MLHSGLNNAGSTLAFINYGNDTTKASLKPINHADGRRLDKSARTPQHQNTNNFICIMHAPVFLMQHLFFPKTNAFLKSPIPLLPNAHKKGYYCC